MMQTSAWFARREVERRGDDEGERSARSMMVDLYALRLGRPLQDDEEAILAERLARLGHHRLHEAVLSFRADVLELWLADDAAS